MAHLRTTALRRLRLLTNRLPQASPAPIQPPTGRTFQTSASKKTDGVFRELTAMRVRTPWIEALRQKQNEGADPTAASSEPSIPAERKLTPKRMSDSYHSVVIPLGQDPWLLDTYLNANGHIRLGTLFMDLDALSGIIAYKHTGEDVTTVTASCDRIVIQHPLTEICDLQLSGKVTYASGRSSMEITMQVAKAPKEGEEVKKEDVLINCAFTMVSLDPKTKKPVNVNPLLCETPEEKRLYALGEHNSKLRKEQKQTSLIKTTPNDAESDLIHAYWQRQLSFHDPATPDRLPSNTHFMDTTILRSATIMQPQFRNRHHFMIFGGFLMKQTFELAFTCAAAFAHARPTFVSLDPSTFMNPVPVGSILYLTATVVYTDPPLIRGSDDPPPKDGAGAANEDKYTRIQVRVDSKVRDVEHGHAKPTGQFNYTFTVEKNIRVLPRTYQEYMMYLDARRRAIQAREYVEAGKGGEGGGGGAGLSPEVAEGSLTE